MLLARTVGLWNVDHVVALKFPAYLIEHPRKTLWLLHQYRQAYDLFDAGLSNPVEGAASEALHRMIKTADNQCFAQARRIFVNSPVTQQRLLHYNGVRSTILPPPLNDPELFTGGAPGDYVFVGGRINAMKRQKLVVEALARSSHTAKLVIAGPPDSPEDALSLRQTVARLGLEDRVQLDLRLVPRQEYASYVNNDAAVTYVPFDEDSLGYVTMEAAATRKTLITTSDAGGILGLVKHEHTGWVSEPRPEALADCLSAACHYRHRQIGYGEAARDLWNSFGITWPATVEALLQ